jgi:hypothetical protein
VQFGIKLNKRGSLWVNCPTVCPTLHQAITDVGLDKTSPTELLNCALLECAALRGFFNGAAKHDSVMYLVLYKLMMKLIDYKRIFRNFTRMLRGNAQCYADVVLRKLS